MQDDPDKFEIVTPSGQPGYVAPRLTGPRASHSAPRRTPRISPRGWLTTIGGIMLAASLLAALGIFRDNQHSDVKTSSADPSSLPDWGTLPPAPESPPPTVDSSPSQSAEPAPSPSAPAKPAPPATYTAVTGEGCPQTKDHGYFRKGFAADWRTPPRGGWTGDGCRGAVVSVPMSGDPRKDDDDNVVVWWFTTAPVTTGNCAVSAYVPDTGTPSDSAGQPAHYLVFGTTDATGPAVGQFDVDQTRNRGRWVEGGRFPVSRGGRLSVRMVTRGIDFGPGRDGAHLGVSALRVSCTAS